MLRSKIHRARVTCANLDYEGSIAIDKKLLEAADILPYEMVHVLNVNNGQRFQTYAIEGEEGSGVISINGAAARLACKGDIVIILSYCTISEEEVKSLKPRLVYVNAQNDIIDQKNVIPVQKAETEWLDDLSQSMKQEFSTHTN
jgi:aspartate 1-decarboxylase